MGCLYIKEAMFANCILFATFCSMGTLVRRKKTWLYCARKVIEFGQLMVDILVHVSCKVEMYIFEIAQLFETDFLSLARQSVPTKEVTIRRDDKPWYDSEIRKFSRIRDRLKSKSEKSNNPCIGKNIKQ